jgi:hypothetical protein
MKSDFANRQNMHLAALSLLFDPANQPVCRGQGPVLFTTRATAQTFPLAAPRTGGLTHSVRLGGWGRRNPRTKR